MEKLYYIREHSTSTIPERAWQHYAMVNKITLITVNTLQEINSETLQEDSVAVGDIIPRWDTTALKGYALKRENLKQANLSNNKLQGKDIDLDTYASLSYLTVTGTTSIKTTSYFDQESEINTLTLHPVQLTQRCITSGIELRGTLSHNWQQKRDTTPFLLKYCKVWNFNEDSLEFRTSIINQLWQHIKHLYTYA